MNLGQLTRAKRKAIREWLFKINPYCCWCGGRMYLKADHGLKWMATLEHLFPRSEGGTNELENLDLAHKVCNL